MYEKKIKLVDRFFMIYVIKYFIFIHTFSYINIKPNKDEYISADKTFPLSLISISIGINKTGIGVFQNVRNQAFSFLLFPLIVLVKLFVVVQQNLFIKQI
jgi:hypothetical protein